MRCLVCSNEFNIKRSILTLFRTNDYLVCNSCLKKNPFEIEFHFFPLSNGRQLEVVSLFHEKKFFHYEGFYEEYAKIFENVRLLNPKKLFILKQIFLVNDEVLKEFDAISQQINTNIMIYTYILRV